VVVQANCRLGDPIEEQSMCDYYSKKNIDEQADRHRIFNPLSGSQQARFGWGDLGLSLSCGNGNGF
jgi:hypothetical protein